MFSVGALSFCAALCVFCRTFFCKYVEKDANRKQLIQNVNKLQEYALICKLYATEVTKDWFHRVFKRLELLLNYCFVTPCLKKKNFAPVVKILDKNVRIYKLENGYKFASTYSAGAARRNANCRVLLLSNVSNIGLRLNDITQPLGTPYKFTPHELGGEKIYVLKSKEHVENVNFCHSNLTVQIINDSLINHKDFEVTFHDANTLTAVTFSVCKVIEARECVPNFLREIE